MTTKLLSFRDLSSKKGVTFSRMHLARLEAAGDFPERVLVGARKIAWVEEEVDSWIAARMSRRAGSLGPLASNASDDETPPLAASPRE